MIKKLRRRFVLLIMLITAISLAVIFATVCLSTKRDLELQSRAMLERVGSGRSHMWRPGEGDEMQAPYFCVTITSAGDIQLETSSFEDFDTALMLDVARAALDEKVPEGRLDEYCLRYRFSGSEGGLRIAFVDISFEKATLRGLMLNLCLLSAGVLAAFFVLSLIISRRMVKPVEIAMDRQRRFVADASHELKTPLTVILANAELLRSAELGGEQERRWLENISQEGGRMRRLIESMLDEARAGSPDARASFADTNLSYLVNERVLVYEPAAFEAGLSMESDIEPDVHAFGNADMLRQLVSILIDNAMKYSSPGGTIKTELSRSGKKSAELRVSNDGEDIPEDVRERLFQRFFRADESHTHSGSYGLGLSIAKSIAENHGGSISFARIGGRNAFTAELPVIK